MKKTRRTKKIIEIEEKYGKPIKNILEDFADNGWIMSSTARELGYTSGGFCKMIKAFELKDRFMRGKGKAAAIEGMRKNSARRHSSAANIDNRVLDAIAEIKAATAYKIAAKNDMCLNHVATAVDRLINQGKISVTKSGNLTTKKLF